MSEPQMIDPTTESLSRVTTTTDLVNLTRLLGLNGSANGKGEQTKPKAYPKVTASGGASPVIDGPPHDCCVPSAIGTLTVYITNAIPSVNHEVRLLTSSGNPTGGGVSLRPGSSSFQVNLPIPANPNTTPMYYFIEVGFKPDPLNPGSPDNGEHQRHRIRIQVMPPLMIGGLSGNPMPGPGQHSPLAVTLTATATGGKPPYDYEFKDGATSKGTVTGVPNGTPASLSTTLTGAGGHPVSVTVTDSLGSQVTSGALPYNLT
ncbi:MAG TPA: hypothetical protein VLM40_19510 [Gemmata sp.]|nr:hypothetical protein [Gemmata sp.]